MKSVTFIGDVHGYFERYKKIIKSTPNDTIQIGDMGVGFINRNGIFSTNPPYDTMVEHNARFIRGNHDNPSVCKRHSQLIKDGHKETIGTSKVMFVGGAWSIDRNYRTENFDWWADEECSYDELVKFVDDYINYKPDVMITHDAPKIAVEGLFGVGTHKPYYPTRTSQAFDIMFEHYQPKLWIFGHWHKTQTDNFNNCKFVCLDELNTLTVEL